MDNIRITTGTYGQLDVYDLNGSDDENAAAFAQPVAQLCLPQLPHELSGSFVQIRETNSCASSSYTCSSSKPRLYDLSPKSQTLCLDIKTWPVRHGANGLAPYGTLLVPANILLEAVDSFGGFPSDSHNNVLAWSDWARNINWCDKSVAETIIFHSASSWMYAQPNMSYDNTHCGIAIWDLKTPSGPLNAPQSKTASGFFKTIVPPQIGTRTVIQVDTEFLPLTSVIADNEYSRCF